MSIFPLVQQHQAQQQPRFVSRKNQRGQSMVEVILATGVVGLVMTTVVSIISVSVSSTVVAKKKALATKYTQEGIEYFRTQRNTVGWETFSEQLVAGGATYCLASLPTGGIPELPARSCTANEFVDAGSVFQRSATITTSQHNGLTGFEIQVTVTWNEGGRTLTSEAKTELRQPYVVYAIASPVIVPIPTPIPSPIPSPAVPLYPTGAVLSFNLASCPDGWTEFTAGRARMIIGTNPSAGGGISARTLLSTGGNETVAVTAAQLPSHTHTLTTADIFDRNSAHVNTDSISNYVSSTDFAVQGGNGWFRTNRHPANNTGTGQAHNNMQPYVALLLCEKT